MEGQQRPAFFCTGAQMTPSSRGTTSTTCRFVGMPANPTVLAFSLIDCVAIEYRANISLVSALASRFLAGILPVGAQANQQVRLANSVLMRG